MTQPTFLYDDACPMCRVYTGAFKRCGWSDRTPFSAIDEEILPRIDLDRGRHEIPLVDVRSGEVLYGLDAMTTVLSRAMPRLRPIFRSPVLLAILKPLYWLITYNRRIIAGTRAPENGYDCAPDVHRGWRLMWIALAIIFATLLGIPGGWTLFGVFFIGAWLISRADRLDSLGHLATTILLASCLSSWMPGKVTILVFWAVLVGELWRRLG
ncbi:DCC1-like thiol-disulfide oxidoreductase family protein [Lewinella sp. W8]|uniref:DCC1-like thiol-disulfide oxidoreductase family protein n=1 Tax=Lewinella sp. W8 TaxID=2528208 RepID=UPI001067E458|nr:DCC1-like thiol-disulfide oxidoreductase family protein [Lewinella sp. W8]MTB51396.1 DUF393 domain-containing protein [Lewinella sp. W8]